jgi:hypothetical protein
MDRVSIRLHRVGGAAVMALGLALAGCNKPAPAAAPAAPPAAAPIAPPAIDATAAAEAKAFLDSLYAHYKTNKNNSFSPMGDNVAQVFDADTIKLLADDAKALKGELGEIDGDYLCDCQDFETITATVAVQAATPTTAKATADFTVFDQKHHNEFDLVKVNGVWRVHDVRERDSADPAALSLRETLEKELKDLVSHPATKGKGDEAP